jgi:hypothetical protein
MYEEKNPISIFNKLKLAEVSHSDSDQYVPMYVCFIDMCAVSITVADSRNTDKRKSKNLIES